MAPQRQRILEEKRSHPVRDDSGSAIGEGTSESLCDVLIDHNRHHPRCDVGFLDLGSRLRRCTCHAALTLATDLKMCFRLVLALHGNGEPIENTGGLNL